jgi:hypothetical protein
MFVTSDDLGFEKPPFACHSLLKTILIICYQDHRVIRGTSE